MDHITNKKSNNRIVFITILLAAIFWYITFGIKLLNFWLSMSIAVTILTIFAITFGGNPFKKKDLTLRTFIMGVGSAVILYGIFVLGNFISQKIFNFAQPQISSIYDIKNKTEATLIILTLLFITSPGEEIFWRNFIQKWFMSKFGGFKGMLIASCIYAAIHISSGNFMLVMAALVAGLFWGYMYWKEENTLMVVISHALWTVGIFVLFPVM